MKKLGHRYANKGVIWHFRDAFPRCRYSDIQLGGLCVNYGI